MNLLENILIYVCSFIYYDGLLLFYEKIKFYENLSIRNKCKICLKSWVSRKMKLSYTGKTYFKVMNMIISEMFYKYVSM